MLSVTEKLATELDVLYGLYLLALDTARKVEPEDDEVTAKVLEIREKMLERTATSATEASNLLHHFETEKNVPASERALIEEKRRMILDVVGKLQQADSQVLRAMHSRLSALRRELARHTERREVLRAYISAPTAPIV